MPLMMNDRELGQLESRLALWADFGDRAAFTAGDARALVEEIRYLRTLAEHLIALHQHDEAIHERDENWITRAKAELARLEARNQQLGKEPPR